MLSSGLPEQVGDDERIARVLTSSGHYSTDRRSAKPPALLPDENGQKSVFRVSGLDESALKQLATAHISGRRHGAMTFLAGDARHEGLDIAPSEPPPRHADLVRWPDGRGDPELRKARQEEVALAIIAKQADFYLWNPPI